MGGIPVIARDTAGLRRQREPCNDGGGRGGDDADDGPGAVDAVEAEGIRRARVAALDAHVIIFVVDMTNPSEAVNAFRQMRGEGDDAEARDVVMASAVEEPDQKMDLPSSFVSSISEHAVPQCQSTSRSVLGLPQPILFVMNKCDQFREGRTALESAEATKMLMETLIAKEVGTAEGRARDAGFAEEDMAPASCVVVSCRKREGLDELVAAIEAQIAKIFAFDEETAGLSGGSTRAISIASVPPLLTRERHRRHAAGCLQALDCFLDAAGAGLPVELAAEELRIAARELGRVVGAIDVEEVLDVLFRDFCIGK